MILGPRDPVDNPFQPIPRPCSIEIMYPREWRIAIPASLMRVDKGPPKAFFLFFWLMFGRLRGQILQKEERPLQNGWQGPGDGSAGRRRPRGAPQAVGEYGLKV